MTVPLLDLKAQFETLRDEVLPHLLDVVESQRFIMGKAVGELEEAIAALCHTNEAVGCASGTDALLLPLMALELKPGDEVVTTPFTFFATAGAVVNAGGTPVFVDIDIATFNIDPHAAESAVTGKTRAVIPVHLYGQFSALEKLLPLSDRGDLVVIEDAAQSIGARRKIDGQWRMAGELGWVGTYSFFPSKNLGAWGDGGMIVTNDPERARLLRLLRTHGGAKQYHHDRVGTNSRLDTLQAAVLLAKLPHLAGWNAARRRNAALYDAGFADVNEITTPYVDPANEHVYHQYTIRVPERDRFKQHLVDNGVGCAVYYPKPLHLQPCFADLGYRAGQFPNAERASQEVLSLPIGPELTETQITHVIDVARGFFS